MLLSSYYIIFVYILIYTCIFYIYIKILSTRNVSTLIEEDIRRKIYTQTFNWWRT